MNGQRRVRHGDVPHNGGCDGHHRHSMCSREGAPESKISLPPPLDAPSVSHSARCSCRAKLPRRIDQYQGVCTRPTTVMVILCHKAVSQAKVSARSAGEGVTAIQSFKRGTSFLADLCFTCLTFRINRQYQIAFKHIRGKLLRLNRLSR